MRVPTADGRLPGHATSGPMGEIALRVAAHDTGVLNVDRPGSESLRIEAGGFLAREMAAKRIGLPK